MEVKQSCVNETDHLDLSTSTHFILSDDMPKVVDSCQGFCKVPL